MEIEKLSEICKLLGDNTRLTILSFLLERELCVCEIVDLLQTSQPNVSQHMRKLKSGGLVNESKKGQWVYYSLNVTDKPFLQGILEQLPSQKEKLAAMSCEQVNCCE